MARYIIPLHGSGKILLEQIKVFCQKTGQPNSAKTRNAMYSELVSQICYHMHPDAREFMGRMMQFPSWATLNFKEERLNPQDYDVRQFADQARAFGLMIYRIINSEEIVFTENSHFLAELVKPDSVIILVMNDYTGIKHQDE
jgi:hypothetical protein